MNTYSYMETDDSRKKGKSAEHLIISELLKNDFDVFVPIVDDGTDLVISNNEGGLVKIQVKSRNIQGNEGLFFIKDFKPRWNFFIVCHDINTGDFFCMPSLKFHENSELERQNGKPVRTLMYKDLKGWCKNGKGMALLKKALEDPDNQIMDVLEDD